MHLLRVIVALQCAGYVVQVLIRGSPFESFLFLTIGIAEPWSRAIDHGIAAVVVCAAVSILVAPSRRVAIALGLVFLANALAAALNGGAFASQLSMFAQSARIAAPFALAFASIGNAQRLLLPALSLTFAIHGVEAIAAHPVFLDYLIRSFRKILGLRLDESTAQSILIVIGIADIVAAASIARRGIRSPMLKYAALWGFLTAGVRIVYGGWYGVADFLLRAAHWGIPLAALRGDKDPAPHAERSTDVSSSELGARKI